MTDISYRDSSDAWSKFEYFVIKKIEDNLATTICEIGGGANPLLSKDLIQEKRLDYSILDISKEELNKATYNYKKIIADINAEDFSLKGNKFDLIFSKMLAEHLKNGRQFHKNILSMLSENGMAIHFFPTLYTLPFLINLLIPEYFAQLLLRMFAPRDEQNHAKFPAYYSWCRGPSKRQIHKLEKLGYEVVEYVGFFGHSQYYRRIPIVKKLHEIKTSYLLKRPNPLLTSFAYLILKKSSSFTNHVNQQRD